MYTEDEGVVIFCPRRAREEPSSLEWLLLLHQIGWLRVAGLPLVAERRAWEGNTSVSLELVDGTIDISRFPWPSELKQIPGHSFYSAIGGENEPMDVFCASIFAVQFLLDMLKSDGQSTAISLWKEKLGEFQQQEAIASDPGQKFALKKQIEEAQRKIQELSG